MKIFSAFLSLFLLAFAPVLKAQDKEYSIIGVGDIMLGTNYPKNYLPPNDGKGLLAPVNDLLKDATVTFGNLEGTVLNSGGTPKRCSDPNACYAFRMPEKYVENLNTAGFDLLSIANNHVGDFGSVGRQNTMKVLGEMGFGYAGQTSCPTAIVERDGLKFGLAAFAPNSGTVDIRKIEEAKAIVKELATKCDIVIVSFHGGAEGSKHQHVPRKIEKYYGENRGDVHAFSHAVIDAGADIVFGHGPHVTRAVELYKGRFIAYSLGNFCTYARFNLRGPGGVAPIVKVFTNKEGEFLRADVTSIRQLGAGGVQLDPNKKAMEYLRTLTAADFPETPLKFTDDGKILKK